MKTIFQKIWELAKPYLNTRMNDIHTEICREFAYRLLKLEGGDEYVVIPAIILHDVGWIEVPEKLQIKAFGPNATEPGLKRKHEIEGSRIAENILRQVHYDRDITLEILKIIDGHDTREVATSLNDKIVKDSDKLFRYSKEGFYIDLERFEESFNEAINRLQNVIDKWFFTDSAKEFALKELTDRLNESGVQG
ncbi:MAG: HD domain-containing protein [Deltaproteobacteria bacterium]|nr:HD domain-containing protein [Deltaproteobacteria bacterium]